jgi:hypothetical protein
MLHFVCPAVLFLDVLICPTPDSRGGGTPRIRDGIKTSPLSRSDRACDSSSPRTGWVFGLATELDGHRNSTNSEQGIVTQRQALPYRSRVREGDSPRLACAVPQYFALTPYWRGGSMAPALSPSGDSSQATLPSSRTGKPRTTGFARTTKTTPYENLPEKVHIG